MTEQEKPLSELIQYFDEMVLEVEKGNFYRESIGAELLLEWPRLSAELKGYEAMMADRHQQLELVERYKYELNELKALFKDLSKRVVPGEVDSGDALIQMLKEREQFKREAAVLLAAVRIPCLQTCDDCYTRLREVVAEVEKMRRGEA